MFGFNVNDPTSLPAIEQYIGSYATPEAAEADTRSNAPQGFDYLEKNFQNITGDAFAHPFEDAENQRARAMTEAAMNGASVATGSNTGMRLLSLPTPGAPLPVQADPTVAAANSKHTAPMFAPVLPSGSLPLSPLGTQEVARANLLKMLQTQGNESRLNSLGLQIPHPDAPNYNQTIQQRAASLGVENELQQLQKNDPHVLDKQITSDPRFAALQSGKVTGGDIHDIAFNPYFRSLSQQNRAKAAMLYHAATNRDYYTDVEAHTQLLADQKAHVQEYLKDIKQLKYDPISGAASKIIERADPLTGKMVQQELPLTAVDKKMMDLAGGPEKLYGVALPGEGGLQPPPGAKMSPSGITQMQKLASDIKAKNPDLPLDQVRDQAIAQMHQMRAAASATPSQGKGVGLLDMLTQFNPKDALAAGIVNPWAKFLNLNKGYLNLAPRVTNAMSALMGSKQRAPLIPDIPMMNTDVSSDETKQRAMAAEYLRQRMGMAGEAFVGQ